MFLSLYLTLWCLTTSLLEKPLFLLLSDTLLASIVLLCASFYSLLESFFSGSRLLYFFTTSTLFFFTFNCWIKNFIYFLKRSFYSYKCISSCCFVYFNSRKSLLRFYHSESGRSPLGVKSIFDSANFLGWIAWDFCNIFCCWDSSYWIEFIFLFSYECWI